MGYFNIFYKITRIIDMLTRKRNRRAIMVILIIIAVIFFLHNKGYCAQSDSEYTTDTSYFIIEEYNLLCDAFKLGFDKYYGKDTSTTNIFNSIFESVQDGKYPYFYRTGSNAQSFRVLSYDRSTSKSYVDTSLVYNDGTRIPSTAYNFTWYGGNRFYYSTFTGEDIYKLKVGGQSADFNFTIPFILLYKVPSQVYECMAKAGYTYENNQDIIDIKALLQEQNNKLDAINDSLTNSTYNEEVVEVDTSTIDNVSDEQITGLFTGVIGSFSNALNSYGGTITKIIPLPHGGQLEIPSNIVSSHLGNLTALVEAFWYFVFGIYLFRFVSNLIHKIKTGDILNGYNNDNEIITSSML